LKITFDAQLLLKGEKTGIGWCAENILKRMPQYRGNDYQLNCFTLSYNSKQLEQIEKYSHLGYHVNKCRWFHDAIYRMIWNFINIPYSFFFGNKSDITVFFNYVIPPGVKGKKITFVYDMAYKAHPETVRRKTRNLLNLALFKSCKKADHIITISEFSKSEIIKYLNIPENKISIMPCGVDTTIYHPNYSKEDIKVIKDKYKIYEDYLLYLGTLEPRKNIERLIQAYAQLKREKPDIPKLVMAGRKGWMYESIFTTVK
jgi:glycosyltransferase involved in cell wall biosynthesis